MSQEFATSIETKVSFRWYELTALLLSAGWLMIVQFLEWPALTHDTFDPWHYDSAVFALIGKLLQEGGTPYLSYWDHKPPLIHFINAAGLIVGGGHVWGIWMVSAAGWISSVVIGYFALRRAFGRWPAILGIVYFAFGVHTVHGELSNLTEQYAVPLQWAALWMFVGLCRSNFDVNHLVQGLGLGAIAASCGFLRPNLIGATVTMWIVATIVLLRKQPFGSWGQFLLGTLGGVTIVTVPLVSYLGMQGSLAAFWDQVIHYNALYSSSTWKLRLRAMFTGLKTSTLYAPLALAAAGWWLSVIRLRHCEMTHPKWPLYALALTWLPIELLLSSVAGRDYAHYFLPVLASLSFLAATFAAELVTQHRGATLRPLQLRQGLIVFSLAVAVTVQPVTDTFWQVRDRGLPRSPSDTIIPVVEYIQAHSNPDDRIFVWGHATPIYFFSDRKPATKYVYILPLLTPAYADNTLVTRFVEDLRQAAPTLIIDASSQEEFSPPLNPWDVAWQYPDTRKPQYAFWKGKAWYALSPSLNAFHDFVMSEYQPVATVGPLRFTIYRRMKP